MCTEIADNLAQGKLLVKQLNLHKATWLLDRAATVNSHAELALAYTCEINS